jgi:hypothetical protein
VGTILIPQEIDASKLRDLTHRGMIVERDALEHLSEQGFEAASDVLAQIKKCEHIEALKPLVIMDPDEDALVLMWRHDDADDPSTVS